MLTREEVIRIIDIFKNDGIDKRTGKKVSEKAVYDFIDSIDELVGQNDASEVIFAPEEYGLKKEATSEEIANFLLKDLKIE